MNAYTLEEVEQKIHAYYRYFHAVEPGIKPRSDMGELGTLWAIWDDFMEAGS